MSKPKILIQLDPDDQPSVFDSVVAVDSGVDQLFRHHSVQNSDVEGLVHGAIFTRGPKDLHNTAIFVGGQNVHDGEAILKKVQSAFFGPMSVSVMLDSNGANTTAAAAVLSASKHIDLSKAKVAVLGGTGPVGQRVARLAARQGAHVAVGSRLLNRSESVCDELSQIDSKWSLTSFATQSDNWMDSIRDATVLFAAGAAGYELISSDELQELSELKIAIDLNAVPPAGIAGVDVMATGSEVHGTMVYGAIGVGGLKMKIHKASLGKLFTANNLVLDANEIYDIGSELIG